MISTQTNARVQPSRFRGEWLAPGDPGYDRVQQAVWNRRFATRPLAIARCVCNSDVIRALEYARAHGIEVTVRATGVSMAPFSSGKGLVIDLSLMRGIWIDPEEKTAWIQGGVRAGDLQLEAGRHDLAGATGIVSSAGVGLILGGGVGHLSRRVGYASDSILAVEVVTASGDVVTASPEKNTELYWAVCGTMGNFGVVTALKIALHEVPPLVLGGTLVWSGAKVRPAINAWIEASKWASDHFNMINVVAKGRCYSWLCHSGANAKEEVERLLASAPPDENALEQVSFAELSFSFDDYFPPQRVALDEAPMKELTDEVIDIMLGAVESPVPEGSSSSYSFEVLARVRGLSRQPKYPNALHNGETPPCWSLAPGAFSADPAEDQLHEAWLAKVLSDLVGTGLLTDRVTPSYVGLIPPDAGRVAGIYGNAIDRLRHLKAKWDPKNVFCNNVNIIPAP